MKLKVLVSTFSCVFLLIGCSLFQRSSRPPVEKVMRLSEAPESIADDLSLEGLKQGIEQNIEQLKARTAMKDMRFGAKVIEKEKYVMALETLLKKLESGASKEAFLGFLKENFEFHEIYGRREWGEVFMTSYYDPVIRGSRKRSAEFSQPLYGMPKDLVNINFDQFLTTFPQKFEGTEGPHEQKSTYSILRARVIKEGREIPEIVPFYSREEIDSGQDPLLKTTEVLAWVDPIESFFLQIQGSGKILFKDGSHIRVGYAAQNGHPYVPIGKYLLDIIPKEKMSLQEIVKHLRAVPQEERDRLLNLNPSYVFFRKLESKSITYFGSEVVAGRTIATDRHYFPKGALGYLEFEKPVFAAEEGIEVTSWQPTSRIVIDQDTGGAIQGPDRLDLYWGEGDDAKQTAGIMKNYGRLYYLLPKDHLLSSLLLSQAGE